MQIEKQLKFTVLTENHEVNGLEGEHGLSIYIEYGPHSCLLDAGQSDVFVRNADKTGVDLEKVQLAVLSHAHYDHGDGFAAFFERNHSTVVYCRHEGLLQDCYSVKPDGTSRYIGISQDMLKNYSDRFSWVKGPAELIPGMWLIPHSTLELEKIGQRTGMYRRKCVMSEKTECTEMQMVPDSFDHEQSLVFETSKGLVIFNSCSHGGVANIVNEVKHAFSERKIYAYIGGFHLKAPGESNGMNCTEQDVKQLGQDLLELGIQHIYTGHCTGERGFEVLKSVMGDKLQALQTGLKVKL